MEAFEYLYRKYNRRVFTLCLRMMKSPVEAEDLTQEIFVYLFSKIGSFRGEAAFATWLHRLTANHVLMHFRRGRVKREKLSDDESMPVEMVRGTENPRHMAIFDRVELDNAIERLPPGYRMVFILHDVEGREHHEIAELIGCSIGTSKSQLHKARMKLRRLLHTNHK
jgi:RNA polymerase sigma-70 factor (ECF subfamily)